MCGPSGNSNFDHQLMSTRQKRRENSWTNTKTIRQPKNLSPINNTKRNYIPGTKRFTVMSFISERRSEGGGDSLLLKIPYQPGTEDNFFLHWFLTSTALSMNNARKGEYPHLSLFLYNCTQDFFFGNFLCTEKPVIAFDILFLRLHSLFSHSTRTSRRNNNIIAGLPISRSSD